MELKVITDTKDRFVFQLPTETHTFCSLLKIELQKIKGVTIATYKIDHPLVGVPEFLVETKGIEPRKAIKEALKSLKKDAQDFEKAVSKL
jgi:DNA-directed RNA polymerase subunit L